MGKRRRESARRMRKRPKTSPGSSSGGGGPSYTARAPPAPRGTPGTVHAVPPATRSSSTSPSSGGGPQGTPRAVHAVPTGRTTRAPAATAPPAARSSSTSSSSGGGPQGTPGAVHPVPTGRTSQAPVTPPSTPSTGSSGGGTTGISTPTTSLPVPPFLTPRVNPPHIQSQYDKRYSEAEGLLTYMKSNCTEQADELWDSKKWHLKIDFDHLKSYDKDLAYKVCNNVNGNDGNNFQGGQELFISATRSFLLDHYETKPLAGRFNSVEEIKLLLQEHVNLSFGRIPKSIRRFKDIPHKSKITNIYAGQRHGLQAIEASDFGRQFLCKIVEYLLGNHKKGWCWDGNWTVDDWEVINGEYVNLLATPIARTGRDQSDKDLDQLAKSVLPTFELQGKLPSFMQHLKDELMSLPPKPGDSLFQKQIISDQDFFDWFYTYIKYHPALMSPLARSTLLQGFYFCMDKLDYKKLKYYESIAKLMWHLDWRRRFHPPSSVHRVMFDVFWHNRTPCCDDMPHENSFVGMLGYHRHLVQHSPDGGRTQWCGGVYVQSMKNSDEAELMAALHNDTLLPKFIRMIFSNGLMKKREFFKHFVAYMDSWGK